MKRAQGGATGASILATVSLFLLIAREMHPVAATALEFVRMASEVATRETEVTERNRKRRLPQDEASERLAKVQRRWYSTVERIQHLEVRVGVGTCLPVSLSLMHCCLTCSCWFLDNVCCRRLAARPSKKRNDCVPKWRPRANRSPSPCLVKWLKWR